MTLYRPIIIGLHGTELSPSEISWLDNLRPYGVILFSRNVENQVQLQALCRSIRKILGNDVVIMVDQEGGRVQRLKSPNWPQLPSALDIGKLWRRHQFAGLEAASSLGQVIGSQLAEVGITHAAGPVLDLHVKGADQVIGNRSFGTTPAEVIPLATAFIDGLSRCGVTAIVKHLPGMGRVESDSHDSLPVIQTPIEVLAESDWIPFQAVSGTRWAMTAHVVIPEWDGLPITTSAKAIKKVREIFGDRLIVSDCLTMGAISGTINERVHSTLDAGVDLALFSNGTDDERQFAVEASGEPRITRDEPSILKPLPSEVVQHLLSKLDRFNNEQITADPTFDRPEVSGLREHPPCRRQRPRFPDQNNQHTTHEQASRCIHLSRASRVSPSLCQSGQPRPRSHRSSGHQQPPTHDNPHKQRCIPDLPNEQQLRPVPCPDCLNKGHP